MADSSGITLAYNWGEFEEKSEKRSSGGGGGGGGRGGGGSDGDQIKARAMAMASAGGDSRAKAGSWEELRKEVDLGNLLGCFDVRRDVP
jgi:hypothetical protein